MHDWLLLNSKIHKMQVEKNEQDVWFLQINRVVVLGGGRKKLLWQLEFGLRTLSMLSMEWNELGSCW
jgi:hypothetical protein